MAAVARPLEEEIRGCVTLLRFTGSLQVTFKDGEYRAPGRLRLLIWPALAVLSDLPFATALLQIFTVPTQLFTAKLFVAHAARIVYQLSLFYAAHFAVTKTERVAAILSRFSRLQRLHCIGCRVPSTPFAATFVLFHGVIVSNFIYTIRSMRITSVVAYFYIAVEVFVLSYTFQLIFFVVLITSLLRGLNERVVSSSEATSLCEINQLRDAREKLFALSDDVQSTFGLLLTIFLFNRALYVIHDINSFLLSLVAIIFTHQHATGHVHGLFFNAIWTVVDSSLVFIFIALCSRLERESKKIGPLLIELAGRLQGASEKESVLWFVTEAASSKFRFSASGLVTINYELLFMAAGSLATNLAILLQSYVMEHDMKWQDFKEN